MVIPLRMPETRMRSTARESGNGFFRQVLSTSSSTEVGARGSQVLVEAGKSGRLLTPRQARSVAADLRIEAARMKRIAEALCSSADEAERG
jgi:hypothetical protein